MSIKETIKVLSNELACVKRQTGPGCDRNCAACDLVLPDELVISAYQTAINILRSQQKAKKNEPLTLEELRYMDGEPVYMVYDGEGGPLEGWALVEVDSEDEGIWLTNSLGGRSEYTFDEGLEDGMTLYRRSPAGGTA